MSSQHVRPLMAFLLVSAICAMVMIHASLAAGLGQVVPHQFAFARGGEQSAHTGDNGRSLDSGVGAASDGFADELVQKRVLTTPGGGTSADTRRETASATTLRTRVHTAPVTPSAPTAPSGHQPGTTTPPSGGTSTPGSGATHAPHPAKAKRFARAQHIREVARAEYAERVADARSQRQLAQEKQSREIARARFVRQVAKAKAARDAALERAREVASGPGDAGGPGDATADPVVVTPDAASSDNATGDTATGDTTTGEPLQ